MISGLWLKRLWAPALAALITLFWWNVIAPPPAALHFFEVEIAASRPVTPRIYFNRGAGLRESESSYQDIHPARGFQTVRLPLPPGKYRSLYFDPSQDGVSVEFRVPRIATFSGRTVREFSPEDFISPTHSRPLSEADMAGDVLTKSEAGNVALNLTPLVEFDPVLRLAFGFWSNASLFVPRGLKAFFWSLAAVFIVRAVWIRRARLLYGARDFVRRNPRGALAICAALAAITSSYPVVFFGKSFVSPTSGVRLLYQDSPTLPEYSDLFLEDTRGADVGAMAWAHQPYTVITRRAVVEEHTLPLWNRYNSSGVTLLGQGQSMFGDPLHFLVTLAGGNAWALDLKFVLCKAIFALGLGWSVWLLTRDFAACVIVIFAGAFIAFYNFRVSHPAIFSMSYAPWILAGWLEMILATDRRALSKALTIWFAAGWFLLNSGTVKEAYLLFGALNLTGAIAFLLAPQSFHWKLRRAVPISIAVIAFMLASAPAWLTFLDALSTARTTYDAPFVLQNPRAWLIGLFDDVFYLEVHPGRPVFAPAANFLILLGCLWALTQIRQLVINRFALALLIGLVAAVTVGFAWMPAAWLLQIPFIRNVYYVNNHFSCIAVIHAGVLAGCGFAAARRGLASRRIGWSVSIIALLLGALLWRYFAANPKLWTDGRGYAGWKEFFALHDDFYANVILMVLALGWLTLAAAHHVRRGRLTVVIFSVSLVAVTIVLGRHGQHLAPGFPTNHLLTTPGSRPDLLVTSPTLEFLRAATSLEPGRVIGTGDSLFPGYMSIHGLESMNGPDAITNGHYRDLLDASRLTPTMGWRFSVMPQSATVNQPLLDFLNVRYLATPVGTRLDGGYDERVASLDFDIYRSRTVWPRAFFTPQLGSYETAADLVAQLSDRAGNQPFAAVQEGDRDAPQPSPRAGLNAAVVSAKEYRLTNNATEFTVQAPGPGFIILHETWLRDDFRATLNGNPAPFFRVNHAFKGIAVDTAGSYHVSFSYWPRHMTVSLFMCGIGIVSFTSLFLCLRRKENRITETPRR